MQTAFLRLLESHKKFRDDAHIKAFLLRVTINLCKDYAKSARRSRRVDMEQTELENLRAAEEAGDPRSAALREAISALRPSYRDVIYLHYFEGYSIAEIAKLLGKSQSTIGTWLVRARNELKEVMTDESDAIP